MAKRGRPSKSGQRTKGGRLKRDGYAAPSFDKGTQRVQSMRERYGTHYSTALGRAYAAGLLGEPSIALDRYQGGKRFVRVYTRVIGGQPYHCPLDQTPRGAESMEFADPERDQREHDWLHAAMNSLDVAGVRPWLDQLISVLYVDHDPPWLARLLHGGKDPADRMVLNAAIQALDILAPAPVVQGIVSATWDQAA